MNIWDITYCLDFADVRNLFKLYSFVDWDLCLLIATESWNGRGWKRYLESYGPSLLQRDNPEQGAQAHIQVAFGDLQGGDSTTSLGNLCQCSVTCTGNKFFRDGSPYSHPPEMEQLPFA